MSVPAADNLRPIADDYYRDSDEHDAIITAADLLDAIDALPRWCRWRFDYPTCNCGWTQALAAHDALPKAGE